jgi:CubicO group peptidase (beta-lactamase class C family)
MEAGKRDSLPADVTRATRRRFGSRDYRIAFLQDGWDQFRRSNHLHRMKIPWYSLTAIQTLAASILFAADAPEPLARNTDVAAALGVFDAWVDWTARHRDQPAVSIGIVYDQELIWAKGYGYADLAKKTPATPATAYRIASISKTFTAHALLQLRDAGKLQLDDPVTKWIPELKLSKIDPASPVITIAHLLTHTAGIPGRWMAPIGTT